MTSYGHNCFRSLVKKDIKCYKELPQLSFQRVCQNIENRKVILTKSKKDSCGNRLYHKVSPTTLLIHKHFIQKYIQLLRSYSARSERKSIFTMNIFSNKFLNLSVIGSLILLVL